MRTAALILMLLRLASAQALVTPEQARAIVARVQPNAAADSIPCNVEAIRPALNLASRLQTGYLLRVPLDAYSGPGHSLTAVVRVTPNGGVPSYLTDRLLLPAGPVAARALDATGVFFLGEGRYRVAWMLVDDAGRACVKNWDLEARPPSGEKVAMAPGTVAGLAAPTSARGRAPLRRLTILLDSAPVLSRAARVEEPAWVEMPVTVGGGRGRAVSQPFDLPAQSRPQTDLRPVDQTLLLGALSAVLEALPASTTRIVAFNLAQQKEIYRSDRFSVASLGEVARALSSAQLATVDYHVLLNPKGHIDLLAGLMNREIRAAPASDAVLFLGPRERFRDDFPASALARRSKSSPPFYFLAYEFPTPPRQSAAPVSGLDVPDDPGALQSAVRNGAAIPNTRAAGLASPVAQAVRKTGGKIFSVYSPRQFARAIRTIEQRASRSAKRP